MTEASPASAFDEGEEVYLGFGHSLTFYPLTWGVRKRMRKEFEKAFTGSANLSPEWEDAVAKILHASAVRGKPDLTIEQLEDALDMRNLPACLRALGIASGMRAVTAEGETEASGTEASDGPRPTVSPTGPDSTAPLSAPPAGPSSSATN